MSKEEKEQQLMQQLAADPKAEPTKVELAIEAIQTCAPYVKWAWINSFGQYHFHARPGFKKYRIGQWEEKAEPEETPIDIAKKPEDNLEF